MVPGDGSWQASQALSQWAVGIWASQIHAWREISKESPLIPTVPLPGKWGQWVPAPRAAGAGAQCEIQLIPKCLWMSPVPATPLSPSSALSCPVSPAQSSRQIPAMLGDHDSKFLLLHPSVFFLPLLCIPSQPPTFPNFSHLSFSSQNTPRGFSLLQFVLFSAILDHPGPPAPTPLPHIEWGEQIQSFPGCCLSLCPETSSVSSSPSPCGVAGFNKPWQAPSTSYWLCFCFFVHVCVSLQCKWVTFIERESGQDFTSLFLEKLVS